MKRQSKKLTGLIVAFILLSAILSACSSSPHSNSSSSEKAAADTSQASANSASTEKKASGGLFSSDAKPGQGQDTGTDNAFNRKVIYHAKLSVEVENYSAKLEKVRQLVSQSGGYILNTSESFQDKAQTGDLTLRIPQKDFFSLMTELEALGERTLEKNIEGQDVTEEYVDLQARLKAKQVVEDRLMQFMKDANKTEDLLKISDNLGKVQEEIEQIKGRVRYLDENVSYSTLKLHMVEKISALQVISERPGIGAQATKALTTSLNNLIAFSRWTVVVLAGSLPFLVVIALVGGLVYWVRRRVKDSEK